MASTMTSGFRTALWATALGLLTPDMAAAQPKQPGCDQVRDIVPELVCVQSAKGVALAGSAERAATLLALGDAGADRFKARFDRVANRYAIVEGTDKAVDQATISKFYAAGFPTALAWLSDTAYRAQIETSVRASVEAQTKNLPEDKRKSALDQAMQQIATALAPEQRRSVEETAVPHELAHDFYRHAYWPDHGRELRAAGVRSTEYGGPGPDWLDETAAVVAEPRESLERRTKQFEDRYRKLLANQAATEDERALIDLPRFVSEEHPANQSVRALTAAAPSSTPGQPAPVQVLAGEQAARISAQAFRFYLQSALFSAYLIERSGDPLVLGKIGAAFGAGRSFADWLASKDNRRLPRTIDAMSADWTRYLQQRFPATS